MATLRNPGLSIHASNKHHFGKRPLIMGGMYGFEAEKVKLRLEGQLTFFLLFLDKRIERHTG